MANPYSSQLRSFSAGIPNARRGLTDLYKARRKGISTHWKGADTLYRGAAKASDASYLGSTKSLGTYENNAQTLLRESGYKGPSLGTDELAAGTPEHAELSAMVKAAVDPYRKFLGAERAATHDWYKGYRGAELTEDKTLKAGLKRELPLALSELEQGIVDTQSNLQTQASAFAQQQAYNASMQSYMQQSLAFQKQMAQGSTGGVGTGSAKGLTPNAAQWQSYAKSRWGVTVGGWRAHGSVPNSDHPKGLAIDIMSSGGFGQGIANDFIGNAAQRGVKYVIYNHRIWSPGQGWRAYHGPNPHTDHVHVSFLY